MVLSVGLQVGDHSMVRVSPGGHESGLARSDATIEVERVGTVVYEGVLVIEGVVRVPRDGHGGRAHNGNTLLEWLDAVERHGSRGSNKRECVVDLRLGRLM